jgi:hypothetical protein
MKNLLEQLKPEILKAIEESADKYPSNAKVLIDELQSQYYVSDIRYGTFINLSEYYLSVFNKLPKDAWANFN